MPGAAGPRQQTTRLYGDQRPPVRQHSRRVALVKLILLSDDSSGSPCGLAVLVDVVDVVILAVSITKVQ